ncbi:hypothetical protein BDV18DRAFT_160334 [Aspergillus unguis]
MDYYINRRGSEAYSTDSEEYYNRTRPPPPSPGDSDDYNYGDYNYDSPDDDHNDDSTGTSTPRDDMQLQHKPKSIKDSPLFSEITKVIQSWDEPRIEPLLDEVRRGMETLKMINTLLDAETAIRVGDADGAEEKVAAALEIAVELGEREYIHRCKELMDQVETLRGLLAQRELERERNEDADDEDDGGSIGRIHSSRRIEAAGLSRGSTPAACENLGDFWGSSAAGGESMWDCDISFATRSQALSPFSLPESPEPRSALQSRASERRYSGDEQKLSAFWECTSDSGNEEEDHLDSDDALSSDNEEVAVPLTNNGKRPQAHIARSTLNYSHIHDPIKSDLRSQRRNASCKESTALVPKPWYLPTNRTDTQYPTLSSEFWNTHRKTQLWLQEAPENNDMDWIQKYEYSPFKPQKAKFTFRKYPPMTEMATRFRKTKIFSQQDWEFIPKKKQWIYFQRGCEGTGEKLSFGFLRWEQNRMQGLLRERRELEEKHGKWLTSLLYWLDRERVLGAMIVCFYLLAVYFSREELLVDGSFETGLDYWVVGAGVYLVVFAIRYWDFYL